MGSDFFDFLAKVALNVWDDEEEIEQVAEFYPEEVLRKLSEHRFRPEGQIPKIGIWVEHRPG